MNNAGNVMNKERALYLYRAHSQSFDLIDMRNLTSTLNIDQSKLTAYFPAAYTSNYTTPYIYAVIFKMYVPG